MNFETYFSQDGIAFRPSPIRAFAALMNDPRTISFAGGAPSPETFPAADLAEIAERVVCDGRNVSLQYGPTRGLVRLREQVAAITRERGISCGDENVMLTAGSQQAVDLISHALIDPGDVVLVELPTYIGGSASFYARRAELAGVQQDDDGIVPDSLDQVAARLQSAGKRVKLLYTIPNFQNPTGRLMSQERRQRVLEIARRRGFLVIEDDPYGQLVFDERADITPMKTRDADDHVIYLSSFSKILAPGLRSGWIVAAAPLIRRFELAKEAADLCSGMLDQSIIAEYCSRGDLPKQITRVRSFYRDRRAVLIGELEKHFSGKATWTDTRGGLFTWMTLTDGRNAEELIEPALANGVAFIPGGPFFVDGSGKNTMRLTFAKETDERMREGVARLAGVLFP